MLSECGAKIKRAMLSRLDYDTTIVNVSPTELKTEGDYLRYEDSHLPSRQQCWSGRRVAQAENRGRDHTQLRCGRPLAHQKHLKKEPQDRGAAGGPDLLCLISL